MSKYDEYCAKIDNDFAILSEEARDKIKAMLWAMADEVYNRGYQKAADNYERKN